LVCSLPRGKTEWQPITLQHYMGAQVVEVTERYAHAAESEKLKRARGASPVDGLRLRIKAPEPKGPKQSRGLGAVTRPVAGKGSHQAPLHSPSCWLRNRTSPGCGFQAVSESKLRERARANSRRGVVHVQAVSCRLLSSAVCEASSRTFGPSR